jgi:hypothetical protein
MPWVHHHNSNTQLTKVNEVNILTFIYMLKAQNTYHSYS